MDKEIDSFKSVTKFHVILPFIFRYFAYFLVLSLFHNHNILFLIKNLIVVMGERVSENN